MAGMASPNAALRMASAGGVEGLGGGVVPLLGTAPPGRSGCGRWRGWPRPGPHADGQGLLVRGWAAAAPQLQSTARLFRLRAVAGWRSPRACCGSPGRARRRGLAATSPLRIQQPRQVVQAGGGVGVALAQHRLVNHQGPLGRGAWQRRSPPAPGAAQPGCSGWGVAGVFFA